MKIVVVGGAGFIGKPFVMQLRKEYDVEVWDLPDINICDFEQIKEKMRECMPDVVVNLAGILGGFKAQQSIRDIFEVNFRGNLNVIQACVVNGIKKFVFASSLTVHGKNEPTNPNTLASPFNPQHAYGSSKAAAEYSLMQYSKPFGMTIVSLRPTIILGDTYIEHAPIGFIKTLLRGEEIEIFGTGLHEREWIWIDDAAAGFFKAVDFCSKSPSGYYPLFLSSNRITMKDLALRCVGLLGGNVKFKESTVQAFTLTCDTTESNKMLGWQPTRNLDYMLEKLEKIFRNRI